MKQPGQIALTPFPFTDLSASKLRPVLLLRLASSRRDDWLVCMISTRLQQAEADLDEVITRDDPDYHRSGLKAPSVLRLSRLAVLDGSILVGAIGALPNERLKELRRRLADWILEG
ncbi:MAG: type II toxin-antitoxin system PemK/MazF family toxin [Nitrococcus sp.]|nr:type II toxin-antitoxin system PemK/MazF family toxin [Nitrococcus sp.]